MLRVAWFDPIFIKLNAPGSNYTLTFPVPPHVQHLVLLPPQRPSYFVPFALWQHADVFLPVPLQCPQLIMLVLFVSAFTEVIEKFELNGRAFCFLPQFEQ